MLSILIGLSLKASHAQPAVAPVLHSQEVSDGSVEILVAVIGEDLTVHPVPKFKLQIFSGASPTAVADISTGFDGRGTAQLPAGRYRISSTLPLEWQGSKYTWSVLFEVVSSAITKLELSSDNAQITKTPSSRVSAESEIYQRVRDAVFLVEAGGGHGSGFLVDSSGLIVTNYHVITGSRYLAVQVDRTRKVRAVEIASSRDKDIAIIRINPSVIIGLNPLIFANSQDGPIVEGERVVAIGNPLAQTSVITSGIVSKIEPDAIISDVNINPGNSGGPLLNTLGQVVGINTFGLLAGGKGPGISGIVRAHLATTLLEQGKRNILTTVVPPADLLPVSPDLTFPSAALREMITSEPNVRAYHVEAGKFDIEVLTPPLVHSLAKRDEVRAAEFQRKRKKQQSEANYDPKDDFFEWGRYAGQYDALVVIQAVPEISMTGGSIALSILAGVGGTNPGPLTYRFKTDFRELRLFRNGKEITPIFPGRVCETVSTATAQVRMNDVGCFGSYTFRPEDFQAGGEFVLNVYSEDNPTKPKIVKISPAVVDRIRLDFAPYYALVAHGSPNTK